MNRQLLARIGIAYSLGAALFALLGVGIVYRLTTAPPPFAPESRTVSINKSGSKRKALQVNGKTLIVDILSADQVKHYRREYLPNGNLKPIEFSGPTEIDGDVSHISIRGNQPLIINGNASEVDINLRGADIIVVRSVLSGRTPSEILTEGTVSVGGDIAHGMITAKEIRYGGKVDQENVMAMGALKHAPLHWP